jgi:allene oxide cyclase
MTLISLRNAFAVSSISVIGSMAFLTSAAIGASINLVERATTDAVTDTGAKDDSAGDILTFANEVYDEANATKVGDDNGWCIRTVPAKAWECVATVTLADGQLTVEGPFLDGKDSVWAITGGTGKYIAARGDMQLHARNAEGSEFDFKFNLTE